MLRLMFVCELCTATYEWPLCEACRCSPVVASVCVDCWWCTSTISNYLSLLRRVFSLRLGIEHIEHTHKTKKKRRTKLCFNQIRELVSLNAKNMPVADAQPTNGTFNDSKLVGSECEFRFQVAICFRWAHGCGLHILRQIVYIYYAVMHRRPIFNSTKSSPYTHTPQHQSELYDLKNEGTSRLRWKESAKMTWKTIDGNGCGMRYVRPNRNSILSS